MGKPPTFTSKNLLSFKSLSKSTFFRVWGKDNAGDSINSLPSIGDDEEDGNNRSEGLMYQDDQEPQTILRQRDIINQKSFLNPGVIKELIRDNRKDICGFVTAFGISTFFVLLFLVLYTSVPRVYRNEVDLPDIDRIVFPVLLPACGGILVSVLLLDLLNSPRKFQRFIGGVLSFVSVVGICVSVLFKARSLPAVSYAVYALLVPLFAGWVKVYFFEHTDNLFYMRAFLIPQILSIILCLFVYPSFILVKGYDWDDDDYLERAGCKVNGTDDIKNGTESKKCPQAFVLYFSPIFLGVLSLLYTCLILVLIDTTLYVRKMKTLKVRTSGRILVGFTLALILSSYIATSIVRSDAGGFDLATIIFGFGIVLVIASIAALTSLFGTSAFVDKIDAESAMMKNLLDVIDSDWFKALLVFFTLPLLALILVVSVVIQGVRKYTPFGKIIVRNEEKNMLITEEASRVLNFYKSFEKGSVIHKAHYIGIILFVLAVLVGRLTTVILSGLNAGLATVPLPWTTLIFILVGAVMFLLPPVPGIPVYLLGGTMLTRSAMEQQHWDFIPAALYATLINYILKLLAIALQQKMIGGYMGNRVWIRSIVNVNNENLRAMKYILEKDGLSIPKICILVGGPDWPTSVLTGILGLSLIQMLIGSLPVIFVIFPMCFSGAVLSVPNSSLFGYSAGFLTIALLAQGLAFVLGAYFIATTISKNKADLDRMDRDLEVDAYREKKQKKKEQVKHEKEWKSLATPWKIGHIISLTFMVLSIYIFQFAGKFCFKDFEVKDSIKEVDGDFVTTLGWVATGFFVLPCMYLAVFNRYISRKIDKGDFQVSNRADTQPQALNMLKINDEI